MKPSFPGIQWRKSLSLAALSVLACSGAALVGCDDGGSLATGGGGTGGTTATTGGGGAGGTGGTSTGGTGGTSTGGASTGGTGGASTGGTGGTGGAMPVCDPQCAANEGIASGCVAITDNAGDSVFGLRMAQLTLTKPQALVSPLVASLLEGAVLMNLSDCYLTGDGTFSWLLELDTGAGTLKTGGAKPNADPTAGYCFANEMLGGVQVAPLEASAAPDAGGKLTMATGGDIVLPIYLGGVAGYILLPLRNLKIVDAQLSPDQNCIGSYNGDQLSPQNMCEPSGGVKRFTEAGAIDAHITLEDADAIVITALNQSLCVLLTGDAGNGGSPKKCARDPGTGAILAKGDWCSPTDSAGGCMDSMKATGTFAASAVQINGDCP